MSDETENEADVSEDLDNEAEGSEPVAKKKKLAGKTLVLFVILPALLLIIGGGGGAMMLLGGGKADAEAPAGGKSGKKEEKKGKDSHGKKDSHGDVKSAEHSEGNGAVIQIGEPGHPSFYTMPKILVTVSNGNGRRSQLLLKLTLEADDPSVFDKVDAVLPRITDQFQMFLREMRVDDLSGSAGDYRIRRELLRRVNMSLYPESVDAVLIEEFIIQ